MKRLKQHWSMRPLSWLLSVAMIWPVLLFMLGSIPAQAQTTADGAPTWAILDFENHSGYGGAEVGRNASDAFVVELGKTNKYQVLSRQTTQQGLADIGLTAPLDTIGLQRLGRDAAVSASAVATGEVAAVSFTNNPRQVTASVIIRVVDTNTGELVNGALAQGRSNGRAIGSNDDDALVNEAINNAAFAAVRQITQFNLPKATVLISRDQNSVVVNRGTRDGLTDGLNMVVTRNGSEVGRIRISDAQADQSTAVVTVRGLGIQPQDKATAIYQLPAFTVGHGILQARNTDVSSDGSSTGKKHSMFSGVTGIILAILAGALLYTLIKRGSGQGSLGGAQVGKAQALEGRADVLGGQGNYPGVTTFGLLSEGSPTRVGVPPANYTPVVVRVTATTGNISINNFLEFHVYRSDFPPGLQDPGFIITGTGGTAAGFTAFGQVPIFSSTGRTALLVFDDGADKQVVTVSKPLLAVATGTGGGNSQGNGFQTITFPRLPGSGIQFFGQRFRYLIEGYYIQPATDGGSTSNPGSPGNTGTTNTSGNGNGGTTGNTTGNTGHPQTFQLTGRTPTNFVTYIIPPILDTPNITSPSGDFASDTVINVTATPPNITENVLELSSSPSFSNKYVYTPQQTGSTTIAPFRTTPPTAQVVRTTLFTNTITDVQRDPNSSPIIWYLRQNQNNSGQDLRLSNLFKNGGPVFARVGTRDPQNGPSQSTNPYVYSDPVQIPY